jgi:hypothetical protein
MKKKLLSLTSLISLLFPQHYVEDPRYHTYGEVIEELNHFNTLYPDITYLDTIGFTTREGIPIVAFKISDNAHMKEDEPSILFNGVHHAEEVLGCEVIMGMIEDLLSRYPEDTLVRKWVDSTEIWFIPVLNPDGHNIVTTAVDTGWRKNLRDNNNNGIIDLDYDGVDLNRNYDFHWDEGGDSIPSGYFYRGPYPFSENETQAIRDLCQRELFVASINYHSPSYSIGEVVYYPWILYDPNAPLLPPDFNIIIHLANRISENIITDDHSGHYWSQIGDGNVGNARNWMYGTLGILSFTIEICSQRVQPPPSEVDDIVERNMEGAYWLLERIHGAGIKVKVVDFQTKVPLVAEVIVKDIDTLGPYPPPRKTHPITGSLYRILLPGEYELEVRKEGYETKNIRFTVEDERRTEIYVELIPINPILHPFTIPFNEKVTIPLELDKETRVIIRVYDRLGRLVREIVDDVYPEGIYNIEWDGRDRNLREVPQGVYFLRMEKGDGIQTFKLVKIKNRR